MSFRRNLVARVFNPCSAPVHGLKTRATDLLVVLFLLAGCQSTPSHLRIATFNASLNRDKPGQLLHDLTAVDADHEQFKNVAEVIQRVDPDILLINEFDYDPAGRAMNEFHKRYLAVSQNGQRPVIYKYKYVASSNTGIPSGYDLDHNGKVVTSAGTRDYGGDSMGFGLFPGQYGFVIYSKYPIDVHHIRTFERFKWKDMPGAMLPVDASGKPWYSDEALKVLRLSSKNHVDLPILLGGKTLHILASHPTPPAFDGPEDRNGKRNHDEIRLWADYLSGGDKASYITDDANGRGRPNIDFSFVLLGDMNADPNDGGSVPGTIQQLLNHPRINATFTPASEGGPDAARIQDANNSSHKTDPKTDTADFNDTGNGPGNLRCDYVLPSRDLHVAGGGVFWPPSNDPLNRLVVMEPKVATSDHRLVWIDVRW